MIPIELKLTNFMSYKYMDEPLSFSSIHTAVLCGPNGHGKSSLLDAITWALWGRARGVDKRGTGTDDLIHHKEPHMEVQLSFELEGQFYRVIRSRSRKGKTGTSRLEFQILADNESRPLTGETIHITQEIINKTLRMDYETFVNSAFIMQGRADTFMVKSANERKEILSEILGLSVYDELEELARDKRRGLNERLKVIDDRIAFITREVELLPLYKQELESAAAELVAVQNEIKKAEEALSKLREEKAVYDMKSAQLAELDARRRQTESDIASIDEQLQALKANTDRARELVQRKEEINSAYAQLIELRKKEEQLSEDAQRHNALEAKINAVKLALSRERSNLESNIDHLSKRKSELEKELSQRMAIESALVSNKMQLAEFERLEKELETMREKYDERRNRKATLEASIEAFKSRLADEENRARMLSEGDSCPLCKKPLDGSEKHAIHADSNRSILEIKNQISAASLELSSTARELESLKTAGISLKEKVKGKNEVQVEAGKLAEKLKLIEKASQEITTVNRQLSDLSLKLNQEAFAQEEQSELKRLQADTQILGYSAAEHQKVKAELKELQKYDQLKANLENAQSNIKMAETSIAALEAQKDAKIKSLAGDKEKIEILAAEISSLKDVRADIQHAETQLAGKKAMEAAGIDRQSTAKVKIDTCNALIQQKDELKNEQKDAAKEAEIFEKLAFIFSKKGIQALIIENTIPEIEEEANSLLHRLTNGQMNLRFVTQKDKKTGGVVETLDLIITDGELGERKYELFSGGEAFRINFAVRIALSKLLARRAGARLETLVIDEGFGTQDEEGKERLIEAITAIQNDFKKIIVITHLDDLKELFPARIEVTKKRGMGSVAAVV